MTTSSPVTPGERVYRCPKCGHKALTGEPEGRFTVACKKCKGRITYDRGRLTWRPRDPADARD